MALSGAEVQIVTNGAARSAVDRRPAAAARFYRLREISVPPPPALGLANDMGAPVWHDVFVDPVGGNDDNDGSSRARAFKSIQAVFFSLPVGTQNRATRIRLMPGVHPGAFMEDRHGTAEFPILVEPADGPGTVTLRPTVQGDAGSLQFDIRGPVAPPPGSNVANPSRADDQLVIRGNVLFNGPAEWPLGVEDEDRGCKDGTCTAGQLRSQNRINTLEPQFANAAGGDFHPAGNLVGQTTTPASDFTWADSPTRPAIPAGDLSNAVLRDFTGALRPAGPPPGAFLPRP